MADGMQKQYEFKLECEVGPSTAAKAEALFYESTAQWFKDFRDEVHPKNHFLRVNPVKVFFSKAESRYERTADLVLKDAGNTGRIIVRRAVSFSCTWPNPAAE